jgi:hypothetical protein
VVFRDFDFSQTRIEFVLEIGEIGAGQIQEKGNVLFYEGRELVLRKHFSLTDTLLFHIFD